LGHFPPAKKRKFSDFHLNILSYDIARPQWVGVGQNTASGMFLRKFQNRPIEGQCIADFGRELGDYLFRRPERGLARYLGGPKGNSAIPPAPLTEL
jgi:hypothetical protein